MENIVKLERALLGNDPGITDAHVNAMADELRARGYDVVIVAYDGDVDSVSPDDWNAALDAVNARFPIE